jgi:hypothetical protein
MSEYRVQKLYYYYYRHYYYYYHTCDICASFRNYQRALLIGHCNSSLLEIVMSRDVTTHNEKLVSRYCRQNILLRDEIRASGGE